MAEMSKEDAIEYLKRKKEIEGVTRYNKEEVEKINKVMKSGKIYGDPVAKLKY